MSKLNHIYNILIIIIVSLLVGTVFFYIYYMNRNSKFLDTFKYHRIKYYENEKIDAYINKIVDNKELVANNLIDKKYVSVVAKDNDNYSSAIFNYYSGNEVGIDKLFKNDGYQLFEIKVAENLSLKYPKFVVEELLHTEKSYEILENKIIVYFNKTELLSNMDETYSVEINYVELIIDNVNVLNYAFQLDSEYTNPNIFKLDPNKKTIAFSFDDGPSGAKTKKVIEALKDNKANATFFLVGNKIFNYRDTVELLDKSGCEIGNHSFDHSNLTKLKGKLQDNIKRADDNIKDVVGYAPGIIRPPYGSINDYVKETIDKTFFLWSVDTNDWYYRDTAHNVNHIIENVKDGDIVLMHDSYDATVETVIQVLPQLYLMGYQVTNITSLANLKNVTLENHHAYRGFSQ